jgi:hypothetical protein
VQIHMHSTIVEPLRHGPAHRQSPWIQIRASSLPIATPSSWPKGIQKGRLTDPGALTTSAIGCRNRIPSVDIAESI